MLTRTPLRRKTALKRGKPIKRTGRLPQKRKRPRRGRERDELRLAFVRTLPCCMPGCSLGPIEAHHETTGRGHGQKQDDRRAMPLCWSHHYDFHGARGLFKGWALEQRRAWQAEQVSKVLALVAPENEAM